MRIAIIGSRKFKDQEILNAVLSEEDITFIVSGGAQGADTLGVNYAKKNNIPYKEYLPNWKDLSNPDAVIKQNQWGQYDALAGMRRNTFIAEDCEKVIAFIDEESKGTLDTVKKARKLGIPVKLVKYKLIKLQNGKI
jgi:hypothetical protein